jgi:hypothetical protein
MSEDLSAEMADFALYLPALSEKDAVHFTKKGAQGLNTVRPADLNFLNKNTRLWKYRWALASAGNFAYSSRSNIVTQRDPKSSFILGDSGGYQIGTGALKGTEKWKQYAREPNEIARLWMKSGIRDDLLRWLEVHCNLATTIDFPLWLRGDQGSPFHACSVESLTKLTLDTLHFIDAHRGRFGNCGFLNVLQGENDDEQNYRYEKVREFNFEGWAYGTNTNKANSLPLFVKRILLLRDENMLGAGREWLHILGQSRISWAVLLTAVQRSIRKTVSDRFNISFDSSSTSLWAGKYDMYADFPKLGENLIDWTIPRREFPNGHYAANHMTNDPFPAGSPLSSRFTVGDLNPVKGPMKPTFGKLSKLLIANHNTYVFIRGFIDANKAAFNGGAVPQEIADAVGVIADLFKTESWAGTLSDKGSILQRATRRPRVTGKANKVTGTPG